MFFWIIIVLLSICSLGVLILFIRSSIDDGILDEGSLLLLFATSFFILILYLVAFNTDYTEKDGGFIYPQETKMLNDDEEVIIKYKGYRWEIEDHKDYVRIIDSNFHLVKTDWYNVFGSFEGSTYELVTFKEEEMIEKEETSIPIKL